MAGTPDIQTLFFQLNSPDLANAATALAQHIRQYYECLIAAKFAEFEALYLVGVYQSSILSTWGEPNRTEREKGS